MALLSKVAEFTLYQAPDGTEFYFEDSDRFLMSEDGYGMPPIEYITQEGPYQHGKTVISYKLRPRIVQLVHRTDGCDRFEYWEKRGQLLDVLRPNRRLLNSNQSGVLKKYLPNGDVFCLDVVLEEGPQFPFVTQNWDFYGFTNSIRFVANDPTFYKEGLKTVHWNYGPSYAELTFPITFPIEFGTTTVLGCPEVEGSIPEPGCEIINYPGTWFSFPRITVTGPMNGFTILCMNTDYKIQLNYLISAGEIVDINLTFGYKTIENDLGINLIGTIDRSTTLADFCVSPDPVAPLGVNRFSITGTETGPGTDVAMDYYERYIGI